MSLLLALLAALGAAVIVITFAQTWAAYGSLPDRIPTNFTWDGRPARFGPRPMIWLMPGVQVFIGCISAFAGYATATHMPGTHGSVLDAVLIPVCVVVMLWRAQLLIISFAQSGAKQMPMTGFWAFCGLVTSIVLVAAFSGR